VYRTDARLTLHVETGRHGGRLRQDHRRMCVWRGGERSQAAKKRERPDQAGAERHDRQLLAHGGGIDDDLAGRFTPTASMHLVESVQKDQSSNIPSSLPSPIQNDSIRFRQILCKQFDFARQIVDKTDINRKMLGWQGVLH
jgi:hypothetical protein